MLRVVADIADSSSAIGDARFPFVPLGDSDELGLGDKVHIFSYPAIGGDSLTYTEGVVSGFLQEDGVNGVAWIKTDAVISGGSSGGTAINDAGELIGVPTLGSELDCRPEDTNGVDHDVEDVGCIPMGGSIGQLRPINLARKLLAEAESAAGSDAGLLNGKAKGLSRAALELPRMALTPAELEQLGFDNYAVAWGQRTDARGVFALYGPELSWAEDYELAGLQDFYILDNVLASPAESTPRHVTTKIWSYADGESAANGFDLLERTIEGQFAVTEGPAPAEFGDKAEVSTWIYTDPASNSLVLSVELTFRGNWLVIAISTLVLLAVSPARQLAVYRASASTTELFYWVEPRSFAGL